MIKLENTKVEDKMNSLPSSEIIELKIQSLIDNTCSRTAIAEWAVTIINDDSVKIDNTTIWEIIKNLGAVDLTLDGDNFLYEVEDFQEWQKELQSHHNL